MTELVSAADHETTAAAVAAERSFLEALGGGCQVPVGAYAEADASDANSLRLTVFMASPNGSAAYRANVAGSASDTAGLAAMAWGRLREQGAAGLLG